MDGCRRRGCAGQKRVLFGIGMLADGDGYIDCLRGIEDKCDQAPDGMISIEGRAEVDSPSQTLSVWKAESRNVADDCLVNPAGFGC